jgi:hypothetical protein
MEWCEVEKLRSQTVDRVQNVRLKGSGAPDGPMEAGGNQSRANNGCLLDVASHTKRHYKSGRAEGKKRRFIKLEADCGQLPYICLCYRLQTG